MSKKFRDLSIRSSVDSSTFLVGTRSNGDGTFTDYLFPSETFGGQGKSAYQVAVDNGFIGSEVQWLNSLKGSDGQDGQDGQDGRDLKFAGVLDSTEDLPLDPPDDIGVYFIPDEENQDIKNMWIWSTSEHEWQNAGQIQMESGLQFNDIEDEFDTEDTYNVFLGDELTETSYIYPGFFVGSDDGVANYEGDGDWEVNKWFTTDKYLEEGEDGEIVFRAQDNHTQIGFDDDGFYPKDWGKWRYTLLCWGDGSNYYVASNGSETNTGVATNVGDLLRIIRTGDVVKAQYSTNEGSSWSDLHTFSHETNDRLYIKAGSEGLTTLKEFKAKNNTA